MPLWIITRTVSPTPAATSGKVGVEVYLRDRLTGNVAHFHAEPDEVAGGTFDPTELLEQVELAGYDPNDFGL